MSQNTARFRVYWNNARHSSATIEEIPPTYVRVPMSFLLADFQVPELIALLTALLAEPREDKQETEQKGE